MHTTKTGTYITGIIDGVKQYVKDRGYEISIKWAGKGYEGRFKVSGDPSPELIMKESLGSHNAILSLHRYKFLPRKTVFRQKQTAGHAVSVAGFNRKFPELLIHDPQYPYKIQTPLHCKLTKIEAAKVEDINGARHTRDLWQIFRNIPDDEYTIEVIDGIFGFEISQK